MLLRNKDKKTLLQLFSSMGFPFEVLAYGSRVEGSAHEGSDLDLVIRSKNREKLPITIFMELKEKIQQSNIPIVVELFDWARLPESFHRNINSLHEVLYSNFETMANEPPVAYKTRKKKK